MRNHSKRMISQAKSGRGEKENREGENKERPQREGKKQGNA
jgi:hypothetical protein